MTKHHKDILRNQLPEFRKNLKFISLFAFLGAKEIFSDEEIDHIKTKPTDQAKTDELFSLLKKGSDCNFNEFIQALYETNQSSLATMLEKADNENV